jgi:hypothetical protein
MKLLSAGNWSPQAALTVVRKAVALNQGDVSALAAIKLIERAIEAEIHADAVRLHALGVRW